VIKTLGIRTGMTVAMGQTLAEVNGLGTVWLNAAVPEALTGRLQAGRRAKATFTAFPERRSQAASRRSCPTCRKPHADRAHRTAQSRRTIAPRHVRLGVFRRTIDARSAHPVRSADPDRQTRLVMLALANGRYQPAEVQTGRESGDNIEILAGLSEGETIVASGQFLIDPEASLSGVQARPAGGMSMAAKPSIAGMLYETMGRIEQLTATSVTLSHEAVPTLGWPAMTMSFALPDPSVARGFKTGDRVRFGFDQPPGSPTIRRMAKVAGQ
jgi:Cu(I)/Ag(I) efflux system membrane fusion protein